MMQVNTYPCTDKAPTPTIVLLHGWGANSAVWQPLLPCLQEFADVVTVDLDFTLPDADNLVSALGLLLPEKFMVLGWSLGGMLATALGMRFPQRVSALVTLASNVSFVERNTWPTAMKQKVFDDFSQFVSHKPSKALVQFMGLVAHGDQAASEQRQWLRQGMKQTDADQLQGGLQYLADMDLSESLSTLSVPALFCFGAEDALVPVQAADRLAQHLQPGQRVQVFAERGHLLHFPESILYSHIRAFLREQAGHAK